MSWLPNISTLLTSTTSEVNATIVYFFPIVVFSFVVAVITAVVGWIIFRVSSWLYNLQNPED